MQNFRKHLMIGVGTTEHWPILAGASLLPCTACSTSCQPVAHVTSLEKRNRSHLNLNDAVCFSSCLLPVGVADTSCICLLCSISRHGHKIMTPTAALHCTHRVQPLGCVLCQKEACLYASVSHCCYTCKLRTRLAPDHCQSTHGQQFSCCSYCYSNRYFVASVVVDVHSGSRKNNNNNVNININSACFVVMVLIKS